MRTILFKTQTRIFQPKSAVMSVQLVIGITLDELNRHMQNSASILGGER